MTNDMISIAAAVLVPTGLLTLIVLIFDRVLPARFVRERHDMAIAVVLAVPVFFFAPFIPGLGISPSVVAPAMDVLPPLPVMGEAFSRPVHLPVMAAETAAPHLGWPLAGIALAIWSMGSLALFVRIVAQMAHLSAMAARAVPVHASLAGLSRPTRISISEEVTGPVLAGLFRPVVLVPSDLPLDERAVVVLEHEIAHLNRRDVPVEIGLRMILALFWWNLPMHILPPLIRREREKLCDLRASSVTGRGDDLADALLEVAGRAVRRRGPALSMAAVGHPSTLAARIRLLAEGTPVRRPAIGLVAMVPLLAAACAAAGPKVEVQRDGEWTPGRFEERLERQAARDWGGNSDEDALYRAAVRGRMKEVHLLLTEGADPNHVSHGDGTPLIGAVRSGNAKILSLLLESGADPDVVAHGDGSPLISAARLGEYDMVIRLLSAGATPDLGVSGDGNPMISAARRGDAAILSLLLEAGGDPNSAVEGDGNPLIGAALGGHAEVVKLLLGVGADPNGYVPNDETPLINAAQQGHVEVAKILIGAGADPSLTVPAPRRLGGPEYRSPISEARARDQRAMVEFLESIGAEHHPPVSR